MATNPMSRGLDKLIRNLQASDGMVHQQVLGRSYC